MPHFTTKEERNPAAAGENGDFIHLFLFFFLAIDQLGNQILS